MRVLLVEDETYLAEAVAHMLKKSHFSVDHAYDGEEGLRLARSDAYDVIVLDIMLPKLSGIEVLKALRQKAQATPVIILSAKGETADKVEGLEIGADDYLAKPFKSSELIARINAITRRHNHATSLDRLEFGDVHLLANDRSLWCGDSHVVLSAKEYDLLELLLGSHGSFIPSETLFYHTWGADTYMETSYLSVYLSYLRRKLRQVGSKVTITARRGIGYKVELPKTDVS